ncbi:hypothetical protein Q7C18_02860 [Nesterenkonia sp. CL21]|nr:hypothetical protein [Nesterenkonia sp. CL21]MDS2171628.1 hypothetical protein [Nesterenkonia sp. CL21]
MDTALKTSTGDISAQGFACGYVKTMTRRDAERIVAALNEATP